MKKLSRRDLVYRVALAGISSALALLLVWLGVVVRFSTLAFFFAAGLVLMMPMSQKYYVSAVLAYIVSAALGFLIVGDIVSVSGYILYFGPMALISGFLKNLNVKWYISYPIKIVFINGMLAVLYFALNAIVLPESLGAWTYVIFAAAGTVILLAIDFVSLLAYKTLSPRLGKALRQKDDKPADEEPLEQPFDDDSELYKADIYPKEDSSDVEKEDDDSGEK